MEIRKAKTEDAKEIAKLRRTTFMKINSKYHTKKQVENLNKTNNYKTILEKMKKREMYCLIEYNQIQGIIDLEKIKSVDFL